MPAKLLIIEHDSQMRGQSLVHAQHFREQTTWKNFRPETLLHCEAQLIVVEASPETPQDRPEASSLPSSDYLIRDTRQSGMRIMESLPRLDSLLEGSRWRPADLSSSESAGLR